MVVFSKMKPLKCELELIDRDLKIREQGGFIPRDKDRFIERVMPLFRCIHPSLGEWQKRLDAVIAEEMIPK
jgi:hypothetical protein